MEQTELVGLTLGAYKLVKIIGRGRTATVYKAYQAGLDRWVAVKVLARDDRSRLARLDREAKAVILLRHPNILMVYEYGIDQTWPYLAMELVEQGSLEKYLSKGPLDPFYAAGLSISIAEALQYAHEQGLVHYDVKPAHILMPRSDWPLLAGFGLGEPAPAKALITESTLAYFAPEQISGAKKIDARADIYALGVIMFEMVAGRLPFAEQNSHRAGPAPAAPHKFNAHCPPELDQIILKAIQKSPDSRYPNMPAMIRALKTFLGGLTMPIDNTDKTPLPSPAPVQTKADQTALKETASAPPARAGQVLSAHLWLREKNATIDLPDLTPDKKELIIGRTRGSQAVDVDLGPYDAGEAGVSRHHARLTKQGLVWLVSDLSSTNGTFVNGVKLISGLPVSLKHGDELRFGLMRCVFLIGPE